VICPTCTACHSTGRAIPHPQPQHSTHLPIDLDALRLSLHASSTTNVHIQNNWECLFDPKVTHARVQEQDYRQHIGSIGWLHGGRTRPVACGLSRLDDCIRAYPRRCKKQPTACICGYGFFWSFLARQACGMHIVHQLMTGLAYDYCILNDINIFRRILGFNKIK
jgi:hypothetical protein